MGAWLLYGLGTDNANVPGFISLCPPVGNGGAANYGSSFLPAIFQGTRIGSAGRPSAAASLSNLTDPRRSADAQRVQLDFVQALNQGALERDRVHPGIEGLIESYELAFRLQGELPRLMDVDNESAATKAIYGIGAAATDNFGRQCLLARRFVAAGVRFVEICHPGWDQHRNLREEHGRNALAVDRPIAGLLTDLKTLGLLEDTLVLWGGEFGRTPYSQAENGRDHNHSGYTMWLAGGGVRAGTVVGRTDDYGYEAIDTKVHIHDWHATILRLMGLDHENLTYRYAGRDMRLTDGKGRVVPEIAG
jgi:hypothetical protein